MTRVIHSISIFFSPIVLTILSLASCSFENKHDSKPGNPSVTPGPNSNPVVAAPPKGIAIKIQQARFGGDGLLQVSVILANGVGGQAIPLNPTLFSVKTFKGLLILPTVPKDHSENGSPLPPQRPEQDGAHESYSSKHWVVTGEDPDLTKLLADGFSVQLKLKFGDFSEMDGPIELIFNELGPQSNAAGRSAVEKIVVDLGTKCGNEYTYLDVDTYNCGACGNYVKESICTDGKPVCKWKSANIVTSDLGKKCVSPEGSSYWVDHCGAVNRDCRKLAPVGGFSFCDSGACVGEFVPKPTNQFHTCKDFCFSMNLNCTDQIFSMRETNLISQNANLVAEPIRRMLRCDETYGHSESETSVCRCVEKKS